MNRLLLAVLIVALASCHEKTENEIPDNILPFPKMADILVDVHILESATGLNVIVQNDTAHRDTNLFYDIFENNKVTKKQYDESMDYYMKHPVLLNQIYDSVLVRLDQVKKDTLR